MHAARNPLFCAWWLWFRCSLHPGRRTVSRRWRLWSGVRPIPETVRSICPAEATICAEICGHFRAEINVLDGSSQRNHEPTENPLDRRSHDRPRPGRPLHLAHISRRQRIETHKGRNAQRPRLNNEDHEANNTRSAKIDRSWPAATRRQETLKAESRPFLVTASNRYLCRLSSHLLNIATASSLDKATFFLPVSSLVTWSILVFELSMSRLGPFIAPTWYNFALMKNLADVLQQLREERDRLDAAIAVLASIPDNASMGGNRQRGRRRFSAAAIAKMRAAQRARRVRERAGRNTTPKARARRRHISPEGLARIRAGQRKRWARIRAAKK